MRVQRLGHIAVAALTLASAASPSPAQEASATPYDRFVVATYVGGSWTTDWLQGDGYSLGFGANPAFGARGTWWVGPRVGVQLQGSYLPSELPTADGLVSDAYRGNPLNLWLYDAAVVARPLFGRPGISDRVGSAYVFVGAGALTADVAGDTRTGCVAPYGRAQACLSYDASRSTVGQGTVGMGTDLFRVTPGLTTYGVFAVHGYDPPFHTEAAPATSCGACRLEDRFALTSRLALGIKTSFGPARFAPVAAPAAAWTRIVAPQQPPRDPALAAPPVAIHACVVENGIPRFVAAAYRPASADSVVVSSAGMERPLRSVYPQPPISAANSYWFVNGEDLYFRGQPFLRFGVSTTLEPATLARVGEYEGVPLFARLDSAAGADEAPGELYVPVGDGCEFQPFRLGDWVRGVRG